MHAEHLNAGAAVGLALAAGDAARRAVEGESGAPLEAQGEALYLEHCAMCHGPNGMGTGLLARRVQPAMLEQRKNLTSAFVIAAARNGIGNMPAIPRGEVSDAEMKAIVDTAHGLGLKVAAHAHSARGIEAAARAGVDSIEHGTFADRPAIQAMKPLIVAVPAGGHPVRP